MVHQDATNGRERGRTSSIIKAGTRYSDCTVTPQQTAGHVGASGITLIELVIVIAIVAVLAAIAVPEYSRYQDKARLTSSISLLDAVRTDLEAYREKSEAYPATINFADFTDQDGKPVVMSLSKESLQTKMFSWDSYSVDKDTFKIICRGIDIGHTVLTLTQAGMVQ